MEFLAYALLCIMGAIILGAALVVVIEYFQGPPG